MIVKVILRNGTELKYDGKDTIVDYEDNVVLHIYKKINGGIIMETLALIPYDVITCVLFENDE